MPQKLKLTQDRIDTICLLIENGTLPDAAAGMYGIARRTLNKYLKLGRDELEETDEDDLGDVHESLFCQFYRRTEEAKSKAEAVLMSKIRMASDGSGDKPGDWKAAAWMLERLNPEVYSQRQSIAMNVAGKVRHEHEGSVDLHLLTDEMLAEQLAAVEARLNAAYAAEEPAELDPVAEVGANPPAVDQPFVAAPRLVRVDLADEPTEPTEPPVPEKPPEPPVNLATFDPQADEW